MNLIKTMVVIVIYIALPPLSPMIGGGGGGDILKFLWNSKHTFEYNFNKSNQLLVQGLLIY